jgi:hypothetical protein
VRLTVLCASAALAATIGLAACSNGGSQAIPGVGGSTTQAPDSHHGLNNKLHVVFMQTKGKIKPAASSCPYTACYDLPAGTAGSGYIGWCVSSTGNCTSGVLPGKWVWLNVFCYTTANCKTYKGVAPAFKLKTMKFSGAIKSKWDPRVGNPTEQLITWTATLKPSKTGNPTYVSEFEACAKTGPYAGECTGVGSEGWIPVVST